MDGREEIPTERYNGLVNVYWRVVMKQGRFMER